MTWKTDKAYNFKVIKELLNLLTDEERLELFNQYCKHYGSLVTIDENGMTKSVMWNEDIATDILKASFAAMSRIVKRAKVTGVFLSSDKEWGTPVTGIWHHMSVKSNNIFKHSLLNASQAMAEKKEDFRNMITACQEFDITYIQQAVNLLKTESLYRSEKCLGIAEWFLDLKNIRNKVKGKEAKDNVFWYAVAMAPVGFCHPKSSMIGTLLEDIASGMSFETVAKRFKDKMHPLQYQRPQAAPTIGNIAQAEKIVEKLGITNSLKRRYARLDEVQSIWIPKVKTESNSKFGVFSHLKPKGIEYPVMSVPAVTMTWEKFYNKVLPEAIEIKYFVPYGNQAYAALTTAVDPEAPPILQWDNEPRNPVAWYLYINGSPASQWNLNSNSFVKVNAICFKPSMWNDNKNEHQGLGINFILEGCKDTRAGASLAIFPETLKSELREIRSTIEAFSKNGKLEGIEEASACGISLHKGHNWNARFKVRTVNGWFEYKLDRWD